MAVVWIQSAIWSNRFKTLLLIVLLPILLFGVLFIVFFLLNYFGNPVSDPTVCEEYFGTAIDNPGTCAYEIHAIETYNTLIEIFTILWPVLLVWCLIAFIFHRKIIFSFTQAKPITRKEYPELYNIVENLCISRGLPTPNIGILEDDSCNAFAVGWNPKKAWIVFSRGIITKLNKQEIEAVAAHELTHIMNKDGLLLVAVIVFIGAVAAIGEILIRSVAKSKGGSGKGNWQGKLVLLIIGVSLFILGYLILPIVQLAISRKREYLADAGSVELTRDKLSMISALRKISQDSVIESIEKDTVSALCISSPFPKTAGFMNRFHEFFSTHPSIENRIELLEKY